VTRAWSALAIAILCACSDGSPAPRTPVITPVDETPRADVPREWFRDITAASGVDFVHEAGVTGEKHLPETMGGGGALADVDEDGDLDLYLIQSGPMRLAGSRAGTFREPTGRLAANRLFLNDGHAKFRDATKESGDGADTHYGMGVAQGDANGDGHVDFYLTNLGADVLLSGDGHARFRDVTRASGISDESWTTGAVFFDPDDDGDLDLFVTGYVEIDLAKPEWCGDRKPGWRSYCHPDQYKGLPDHYWKNKGDGTFEDATASAGLEDAAGKGLCAIATDVDGDLDLDLYVANDSTENRLWKNRGDGTFEDATLESGTGLDRYGRTEASMGLASGDVDGDLDLDLFVTGFDDESDTLYENKGAGLFEDTTVQHGLELATRLPVGFGTVLSDFDEDGDLDLAIANGHIIDNIHLYHDAKTHAQRALLYENDGRGHFTDVSATLGGPLTATPFVGRGLLSGDLDGDGDPDLVLTQCGAQAVILENTHGSGRSITIGGLPIGARVVVKTSSGRSVVREAGPAPSYLGQCDPSVHMGLGNERAVSITIQRRGQPEESLIDEALFARDRLRLQFLGGKLKLSATSR
jgi:hypothetical protein